MTTLLLFATLFLGGGAEPSFAAMPWEQQAEPRKPPPKPKPINPEETGGPRGSGVILRGTVVDAAGKEVPNAKVKLALGADPGQLWETVTDASGRFQMLDLPIGSFTLELSRPGFRTTRHAGLKLDSLLCSVRVAMKPGAPENVLTERFVELRGRVRDARGDPVPEAQVEVRGAAFARGLSLLTDAEGEFQVSNFQSGAYTVHVTAPGFHAAEKALEVKSEGDSKPVAVTIEMRKIG